MRRFLGRLHSRSSTEREAVVDEESRFLEEALRGTAWLAGSYMSGEDESARGLRARVASFASFAERAGESRGATAAGYRGLLPGQLVALRMRRGGAGERGWEAKVTSARSAADGEAFEEAEDLSLGGALRVLREAYAQGGGGVKIVASRRAALFGAPPLLPFLFALSVDFLVANPLTFPASPSGGRVRVLRSFVVETRARGTPGRVNDVVERVVAREAAGARSGVALQAVGRAFDSFRPSGAMRSWLKRVTGRSYDRRLNPRRRRRVRGAGIVRNQWVFYRRRGYHEAQFRGILALLGRESAGGFGAESGWAALNPHLLDLGDPPVSPSPRRACALRAKEGLGAALRIALSRGMSVSLASLSSAAHQGSHANVLVMLRNPRRPGTVRAVMLDPHGFFLFGADMLARVRAAVFSALGRARVSGVTACKVPRRLAVQYSSEGSCAPAALAHALGLCRTFARSPPPPAGLCERLFRAVRDRDVVLVLQLSSTL